MVKDFLRKIISEHDPISSRRVITLATAVLFILTCFTVLILLVVTFTYVTQLEKVNIAALKIMADALTEVLYYEFMIIISGLAFITAPHFAKALVSSLSALVRRKTQTYETDDATTTVETEDFEPEEEYPQNEGEENEELLLQEESEMTPRKTTTKRTVKRKTN